MLAIMRRGGTMRGRLIFAVLVARLTGWISRMTGRGGSSLPGLVARRIDPRVLSELTQDLVQGVALLTGTNGKTTTAAMIRHILSQSGRATVSNRSGANLILGLTASVVQAESGFRIYPRADLALLETDEATMPRASQEIGPRVISVTNFFRDQLDRYGELSTTVQFVRRGIDHLSPDGQLVLNADDPQVARLGDSAQHVIYYGLEGSSDSSLGEYDTLDARFCPHCGAALSYERRYFAHLGHYSCSGCGWVRPLPQVSVESWNREQHTLTLRIRDEVHTVPWTMPGIYNIYNQIAAIATALSLNVAVAEIKAALESFRPAFGRMETFSVGAQTICIALVKNPVGFNQVLATMEEEKTAVSVLVVINDRYADGQDVSWLWDVDFEKWAHRMPVRRWWISGVRAYDMAIRLKYAGVNPELIEVEVNVLMALKRAVQGIEDVPLYILPTYTAMLEVREYFTQEKLVKHFREG